MHLGCQKKQGSTGEITADMIHGCYMRYKTFLKVCHPHSQNAYKTMQCIYVTLANTHM